MYAEGHRPEVVQGEGDDNGNDDLGYRGRAAPDIRGPGYVIVPGLLPVDEVRLLLDTFMTMHAGGPIPGCFMPRIYSELSTASETRAGVDLGLAPVLEAVSGEDILDRYPRMMHPHRVNAVAMQYMLDRRIAAVLANLFGEEPLAAQSMLYFKPAGARGQALHQDNFYLKVEPGTCIAAWMALDPADRENGGLEVVPGTHRMAIFVRKRRMRQLPLPESTPVPAGLKPSQSIWRREMCCSSTAAWCMDRSPIALPIGFVARLSATTSGGPLSACHTGIGRS